MKKKSIGIIGAGKHFINKIYPVLSKSKFFQIKGILRKKNKPFKKIPLLSNQDFFSQNFDFVYICCPNSFHEKYIIKSLNSNYHVICEKPFLTKKKNLKKILTLAKKKNKLLFECFMYTYHPVFGYLKKIIKSKKYGKIRYLISNFRFPSLHRRDNRYKKNEGNGFFNDSASYLVSLESYLFENFNSKFKFQSAKLKKNVDLRGYIYLKKNNEIRHYFWGEGQNYKNNIEIFFDEATIHIDKFFSKAKKEQISIKVHRKKNLKEIHFKPVDQFDIMFKKIIKNYLKKEFKLLNYSLIENQINLMAKFNK